MFIPSYGFSEAASQTTGSGLINMGQNASLTLFVVGAAVTGIYLAANYGAKLLTRRAHRNGDRSTTFSTGPLVNLVGLAGGLTMVAAVSGFSWLSGFSAAGPTNLPTWEIG